MSKILPVLFVFVVLIVGGFDVGVITNNDKTINISEKSEKASPPLFFPKIADISKQLSSYSYEEQAQSQGGERSLLRNIAGSNWNKGLAAFRESNFKSALDNFSLILNSDNKISSRDKAAVAFWAYKSALKLEDKAQAQKYLDLAAGESPSFYSMIARNIEGKDLVSASGQLNLAMQYIGASQDENKSTYPIPNIKPVSGYKIEPALLFAIMRRESGFDPNAVSASGAIGLMQLMPDTANKMARNLRLSGASINPSINVALGQNYLKRLMQEPTIGNNLIFLIAAYNAGPVAVDRWQNSLSYNNDPLLFIESIPYSGTRDYVVSVIGNYWVYSKLFGGDNSSLAMISQGDWATYSGTLSRNIAGVATIHKDVD